ncbi:MAG: hypothetical protein WB870_00570 [Gallionellaceae bacterium]
MHIGVAYRPSTSKNQRLLTSVSPCHPPIKEQQAIAACLDQETARIDQFTAKVEAAIEALTKDRQALITAAVTGKKYIPIEV